MPIAGLNYRKILLAALVMAAAGFVGGTAYYYLPGDTGAPDKRQVFDPQWQTCDPGDACAVLLSPCGIWETVNGKFASEAAEYYQHMISLVDESGKFHCAQMPVFGPRPPAICQAGLCAIMRQAPTGID